MIRNGGLTTMTELVENLAEGRMKKEKRKRPSHMAYTTGGTELAPH